MRQRGATAHKDCGWASKHTKKGPPLMKMERAPKSAKERPPIVNIERAPKCATKGPALIKIDGGRSKMGHTGVSAHKIERVPKIRHKGASAHKH